MRLCTVHTDELQPFFGILIRDRILRLGEAAAHFKLRPAQRIHFQSMRQYLEGLPHSEKHLRKMLQQIADDPSSVTGKAEDGKPLLVAEKDVTFLAPVPDARKILCVGLNYRDHCEEQNKPVPDFPIIFNKFPTSLNGHEGEIPLPLKVDDRIDYEAEFAFVIGRAATRVKKRTAMNHVAGFTIMNDISARGLQWREKQWSRAKGFDGAGPCGPYLVTPDEIADPHHLSIRLRLNGETMQSSNTKNLVFGIEHLIQHISEVITLEPGDIVSTGTPGGVGVYRDPELFLKPGDVVEVEIEKLGVLRNRCVKR